MAIIALPQRLHKPLEAELTAAPLVMDNDAVMVPLRPEGGQPTGKTPWREVKVGVLARMCHHIYARCMRAVSGCVYCPSPHRGRLPATVATHGCRILPRSYLLWCRR